MNKTTNKADVFRSRAMLATLHISVWRGEAVDAEASRNVWKSSKAEDDAGVFVKRLVSNEALVGIKQAANSARTLHYDLTLPWGKNGARILPVTMYWTYVDRMGVIRNEFDKAVNTFMRAYSSEIKRAEKRLGSLFDADQYPEPKALRSRFAIDVEMCPVPSGNDFRLDIVKKEMAKLRKDTEGRVIEKFAGAQREVYRRIHDALFTLAERMGEYETVDGRQHGIFRKNIVENVQELADTLPNFNVTGDPEIDKIAREIGDKFNVTAAELRQSAPMRRDVRASAEAILKRIEGAL